MWFVDLQQQWYSGVNICPESLVDDDPGRKELGSGPYWMCEAVL